MQFSEYWLRQFVDPKVSSDELGHLLTMAGLEVEEQEPAAPEFSKVVVGHILSTEGHPNADKLKICRVDVGESNPLQIVCGAPNAAAGMRVPCAVVGAQLPGGFKIKAAKLRGVESAGMLCSAKELGLSDDHGGLLPLDPEAVPGTDVRDLLRLDDTLFTIKLTPNRADCLSLLGVAREVAAITGASMSVPECMPVAAQTDLVRAITLEVPEACPRYCGRVISGVNAKAATPAWMKERLARCGIRSISALVDITNYVMLELGQPLHAFDNRKLSGGIVVRFPKDGETLLLLNEQQVTPAADTLLITDDSGPLALAGIMGGEVTGISLETEDVFLESAFFAPDAIAGRARTYGFSSDASHRYERGVDFDLSPRAMERATALILEICGGAAGPAVEAVEPSHLPRRQPVRFRPARIRRLLGVAVDDVEMVRLMQGVHLRVEEDGDAFLVYPPSYRFDIEIEEDLVEEVARLHGYENMPAPEPTGKLAMLSRTESGRSSWDVRRLLAARDYQEVVNYSFVEEQWESGLHGNADPIRLANPIASQMSVMRSSLIGSLVDNLATNRRRQLNRVRVFEAGRCFRRSPDGAPVTGYDQPLMLGALASGTALPEQWGVPARNVDFFDVKGDLEALFAPRTLEFRRIAHPALHPGRSAEVSLEGVAIGVIGELHPVWVQCFDLGPAPVVFEVRLDAALGANLPLYAPISRMQAVVRDLALVVDVNRPVADILAALRAEAKAPVQSIELFDVYQGKGIDPEKKSLAFRVLMQDTQRTLEDAEVEAAVASLTRHAEVAFGARLR